MTRSPIASAWYLIEEPKPFSQSLLWQWQADYFQARGVAAWRNGEVPHYVTSNPTIAHAYAQIIFAFWRDYQRIQPTETPLTICELGAGSGRFAFYFLQQLARLCAEADVPLTTFRYVLTDFTQSNLTAWEKHPRFQPFFASGVLDTALFDITQTEELVLQNGRQTIRRNDLSLPLVVIANYFFDTIPQELFRIQQGTCQRCWVSLVSEQDPQTLEIAERLKAVQCLYETHSEAEPFYTEPAFQQLLQTYQQTLSNTYLLFPATGLQGLQRLKALSRAGLFVLSADKGEFHLPDLDEKPVPNLAHHGSFSLNVNYHAFQAFCEQNGGSALMPPTQQPNINVYGFLFCAETSRFMDTRRAYQRAVVDFSPDDFYIITKQVRPLISQLTVEEILAYLRLTRYDAHQFGRYLPALSRLSDTFTPHQHQAICQAVDKVWNSYFPLGEEEDLAAGIAALLYAMDAYAQALTYYSYSMAIYGEDTGILYNVAVCHHMLNQDEKVPPLLNKILQYDPDNTEAQTLWEQHQKAKRA